MAQLANKVIEFSVDGKNWKRWTMTYSEYVDMYKQECLEQHPEAQVRVVER